MITLFGDAPGQEVRASGRARMVRAVAPAVLLAAAAEGLFVHAAAVGAAAADLPALGTLLALGPAGSVAGFAVSGVVFPHHHPGGIFRMAALAYGGAALLIVHADGAAAPGLLRVAGGCAFGALLRAGLSLVKDGVPRRDRAHALTLLMLCIPAGGGLAALLAGAVAPRSGDLLRAGSALSAAGAALAWWWPPAACALPGSPRAEAPATRPWLTPAASGGPRREVVALFACVFSLGVSYGTALLCIVLGDVSTDGPITVAPYVPGAFHLGGAIGLASAAPLVRWAGSRAALSGACAAGSVVPAVLASAGFTIPGIATGALMVVSSAALFVAAASLYAIGACAWPAEARRAGAHAAVAFGGLGYTLAPLAVMSVLHVRGVAGALWLWSGCVGLVLVAGAGIVQRHVPPARRVSERRRHASGGCREPVRPGVRTVHGCDWCGGG